MRNVADAGAGDLMRLDADELAALEADRPERTGMKSDDRVAERRLAHAVAADDGKDAALQRQRDALKRMRLAVIDLQVLTCRIGFAFWRR